MANPPQRNAAQRNAAQSNAERLITIDISKEDLHFNSAHFTIFSATEREDLHGHTFYVKASITSAVDDNGMAFDYNIVKDALRSLCDSLDEKVLLPECSPHLNLAQEDGYLVARFDGEKLPFLPRDVLTLPLKNITVEELAPWFLDALCEREQVAALDITELTVQVSSGAGQWAAITVQPANGRQRKASEGLRVEEKSA